MTIVVNFMATAYFSDAGAIKPKYQDHPEGGIVGNALIFYEGDHIDNARRKHSVPAERIYRLAVNTNQEFNQGRDIPFKLDHRKSLAEKDGSVNKLGNIASEISCRPITEDDLANSRLKHLVGKIGAFADIHVRKLVDSVKDKTVRAISAGIDPVADRFVEVSAVTDPSLAGATLLFSRSEDYAYFNHGIPSYSEAKEAIQQRQKPHEELLKMHDIFVGALMAIELKEEDRDGVPTNTQAMKRQALEEYVEDIADFLNIDVDGEEESDLNPEDIYNPNPYDQNLYQPPQGAMGGQFSEPEPEEDNLIEFSTQRPKSKRRGRA